MPRQCLAKGLIIMAEGRWHNARRLCQACKLRMFFYYKFQDVMPSVHGWVLACSWSLCLSERLDALAISKTSDALSFFFKSFYAKGFAFQTPGRECGRGKLKEKYSSHFMMPSNLPWKKVAFALPFRVYSAFLASTECVSGSASNNSCVHELLSRPAWHDCLNC